MRVAVVGAGLMGAQIGCEYALGGHEVALVARNTDRVRERVEDALRLVAGLDLFSEEEAGAARGRIAVGSDLEAAAVCDVAVESVPEDMELKASLLRAVAGASPDAILATNTSSLSITELGERVGAPERTIGTHYLNPPILMSPVEVVSGARTSPEIVERVRETLRALGKRPVLAGDVPGFVWNRLQMAVLREGLWIVENGVASPDTVDEVLTYGLARRWSNVGFFKAIALGGVGTWQRAAANLVPELSTAKELPDLRRWVDPDDPALDDLAQRRDRGLAHDLIEERRDDE